MFTDHDPEYPSTVLALSRVAFFTVMADKCTNVANKEQFAVCIRWVDKSLDSHEDVIGVYNIGTIDANTDSSNLQCAVVHESNNGTVP